MAHPEPNPRSAPDAEPAEPSGPGPARYCPRCYATSPWSATRCGRCGADLTVEDDFDDRLVWALDHPDTATAMIAADVLARRGTRRAIPALLRVVESPDPYRAQAAAAALAVFADDPRVAEAAPRLRTHRSALVRSAFAAGGPAPGARP